MNCFTGAADKTVLAAFHSTRHDFRRRWREMSSTDFDSFPGFNQAPACKSRDAISHLHTTARCFPSLGGHAFSFGCRCYRLEAASAQDVMQRCPCVYCLPLGLEHSASTVKQHCRENQVDWDAYWASEKRRRTNGSGGSSESAGGGDYSSGSRDGASSSGEADGAGDNASGGTDVSDGRGSDAVDTTQSGGGASADRRINTGGAATPSRDAQPQHATGDAAHPQLLRGADSDIPMAAGLAADDGGDASECSETSSEASVPSDQQTDEPDAALSDDSSSGSDDEQPADGTAPAPASGGGAGGNAGAAAAGAGAAAAGADAAAGSEDDGELAAVGSSSGAAGGGARTKHGGPPRSASARRLEQQCCFVYLCARQTNGRDAYVSSGPPVSISMHQAKPSLLEVTNCFLRSCAEPLYAAAPDGTHPPPSVLEYLQMKLRLARQSNMTQPTLEKVLRQDADELLPQPNNAPGSLYQIKKLLSRFGAGVGSRAIPECRQRDCLFYGDLADAAACPNCQGAGPPARRPAMARLPLRRPGARTPGDVPGPLGGMAAGAAPAAGRQGRPQRCLG